MFASNIPALRGRMVDAYERSQKRVAPSTVLCEGGKGALAGALITLAVAGVCRFQGQLPPFDRIVPLLGVYSGGLALLAGARGAFMSRSWADKDFIFSVLDAEAVFSLEGDQSQKPDHVYEGLESSIAVKKDQVVKELSKFYFLKGFRLEESDREGVAVMARRVGHHPEQYGLSIVVPWRGIGRAVPGGLFGHMGFVLRGVRHYAGETKTITAISQAKISELVKAAGFSIKDGVTLSEEQRSTEVVAAFLNLASDLGLGQTAVRELLSEEDRFEATKRRLEAQSKPDFGNKLELSDELCRKVADFMNQLRAL